MPRVIAITGFAGAGKSTVASMLSSQHSFKLVKFADPLKDMLRVMGLGQQELEGERKGLPSRLLGGKSPRFAMQTLGTDWGRALISEDIWATIWRSRAKQQLVDGFSVVCDDCRFENEVRAVKDLGGDLWNVRRSGVRGGSHVSEAGIAARWADRQIKNDSTLSELLATVAEIMSEE